MAQEQENGKARVAVASKGDNQINEHFGHADAFLIYEVTANAVCFLERRLVEHYCQGGYGDEDKREAILRVLADCAACFVARIGDGPRGRLRGARRRPYFQRLATTEPKSRSLRGALKVKN